MSTMAVDILGGVSEAPVHEDWEGGHRRGHLAAELAADR
jgi:hypothetical protein